MVQLNNTFAQLKVSDAAPAVQQKPSRPAKVAPRTRNAENSVADSDEDTSAPPPYALLSLLARLFAPLRRSPNFAATLQHVKGLLYDKQYLAAFGTDTDAGERWRQVYAARWVPSRAIIYERIFEECALAHHLEWDRTEQLASAANRSAADALAQERATAKLRRRLKQEGRTPEQVREALAEMEAQAGREAEEARELASRNGADEVVEAVMIGAGAGSEVVALGAVLGAAAAAEARRLQQQQQQQQQQQAEDAPTPPRRPRIKVRAVDQGSWGTLLDTMTGGLREEYPSLDGTLDAAAQENPAFDVDFIRGDVLDATTAAGRLDFSSPNLRLVTICFTVTELLLQSRLGTLRLLSSISRSAPRGTLLLIVESASLAQIPLGQEGRTYPLGQLLDHALCGADERESGSSDKSAWEVVRSEDAKWYRMADDADEVYNAAGAGFRVKLENSRVVLRLYRKR
ncbi:hypothetical protein JCM8202_005416 [Rhodotorula sphaerocarpa]